MDFIDRLRSKPLNVRKRIALVASAVFTLAIFALWATVLNFNLDKKKDVAPAAAADTTENPFTMFAEIVSKGWSGFINNVSTISSSEQKPQSAVVSSTPKEGDSIKITQ